MIFVTKDLMGPFRAIYELCIERAINVLKDPIHKKIVQNLKENYSQLWVDCLSESAAEPFGVITLADSWNNNLIFCYQKPGEVRI